MVTMTQAISNRTSSASKATPTPKVERMTLLAVALGAMLAPLNSTMMAVALPNAMGEFNAGLASASWLITAYLVTLASLMPVAGRLGDMLGHRRLILGGLTLFGISSIAAALAPNLLVLICFRVLQATAAALVLPNGIAVVRNVVPEERRGRGVGLIGAAVAVAVASGPVLGSMLLEMVGWRDLFYVNLLLVLPAVVIGWRWIPKNSVRPARNRFDIVGALMLLIILLGSAWLVISIGKGEAFGALCLGALALIAVVIVFVRHELRHPDPVIQPSFFRRKAFVAAIGSGGLINLAFYTVLMGVPILLASRISASGLEAGLVLMALPVAMIVTFPFGGRLADTFGRRLPTTVGLGLLALGIAPMAVTGADVADLLVLVISVVFVGIGVGLAAPGLQTAVVESVDKGAAGVASGVYSTSLYLGGITASAILGGLLGADRGNVDALGILFVIGLIAALIATFVSLGLRARPAERHAD